MRAFLVNQFAHPSKIPVFVLLHPENVDVTEDDLCSVDNVPEPVPKEGQVLCDVYTAYVCNHSQIHGQSTNEHYGLRFLQCS